MKVVINSCFGGFGLSTEACEWLIKHKKWKVTEFNEEGTYKNPKADLCLTGEKQGTFLEKYYLVQDDEEIRTNKDLIECIETIGSKKASGYCASLKIIKIPDNIEYEIDEYDGNESIHEKHNSWN